MQTSFRGHRWQLSNGSTTCEQTLTDEAEQELVLVAPAPVRTEAEGAAPAALPIGDAADASGAPRESGFYGQHVTIGKTQLCVQAHASVSPWALAAAAEVVLKMLEHSPTAVVERLACAGCSIAVIGREQLTSDVPEHAWLSGTKTQATGSLRMATRRPSTPGWRRRCRRSRGPLGRRARAHALLTRLLNSEARHEVARACATSAIIWRFPEEFGLTPVVCFVSTAVYSNPVT